MRFKEGDRVRVSEREVTSADMKNGTFYRYFCGLTGIVDRVYGKEICIKVDLDALPGDILKRHKSIQESIRRKWLNGLSGEARNRLTPQEKQFELAYTILIQSSDLEKVKAGKAKPAAIKSARRLAPPPKKAPRKAAKPESGKAEAGPPTKAEKPKPARETAQAKPAPKAAPAGKVKASAARATARAAKGAAKGTAKAAPKSAAKAGPGPAAKATAKLAVKAKAAAKSARKPAPKAAAKAGPKKGGAKVAPVKSVTAADLDAKERAFLKQRRKALKGKR